MRSCCTPRGFRRLALGRKLNDVETAHVKELDVQGFFEQPERTPPQLGALDAQMQRFGSQLHAAHHERSREPALERFDMHFVWQVRCHTPPDELQAAIGSRYPDQQCDRRSAVRRRSSQRL